MMKYNFYVTTSQSGGEGKVNTYTEVMTDIQTELIVKIGRPKGIETTHSIGLGFSRRIIQSNL